MLPLAEARGLTCLKHVTQAAISFISRHVTHSPHVGGRLLPAHSVDGFVWQTGLSSDLPHPPRHTLHIPPPPSRTRDSVSHIARGAPLPASPTPSLDWELREGRAIVTGFLYCCPHSWISPWHIEALSDPLANERISPASKATIGPRSRVRGVLSGECHASPRQNQSGQVLAEPSCLSAVARVSSEGWWT